MSKENEIPEEDETCPKCRKPEASVAHECGDCGLDVCQDCFNFEKILCVDCDNEI